MASRTALRTLLLSATLFAAAAVLASPRAHAQYGGGSHVGLGLGYGVGSGPAADQSSGLTGTLDTKGIAWAMVFALDGSSDGDGLGFGYFFAGTLGGFHESARRSGGDWSPDFDLIGDMRLGLSANYRIAQKQLLFKLRYFNWYNAGGLRAYHGNSDDPAALGVGVAWKRLGVDVDYGTDAIPGVLVAARDWDLLRIEARYKVSIWDDGRMSWMAGLRYEGGFLQRSASTSGPDTSTNMVLVFLSMAGGDK